MTAANDQSDITHYVLYWGKNANEKLDGYAMAPIATIAKSDSSFYTFYLPGNPIPDNATHLMVFTKNDAGEMLDGESVAIG